MNIEELYVKISNIEYDNHLKAGLYFSIIQLKRSDVSNCEFGNSIYLDAKNFISVYINSVEDRDLGYDIIDTNKIIKCINLCGNTQEQYRLAQNAYRLLKTKGFEDESCILKKTINSKKTELIKKSPFCTNKYIKLLLHLSTYNLYTIILAISFIFFISFIVLLPAPFANWQIFHITYHHYSNSFIINHFINILTNVFGIESTFKIETNSLFGILSIITIKLFYLVFIVNYLYKKVIDILNNN